jgi:hypothetical protein
VLASQIGCLRASLVLAQHRNDLLLGELFRFIVRPLSEAEL